MRLVGYMEMLVADVLVVGAGIAGVSAAIEAARAGARVVLASLGETFSGSSFYGGTWGLGLVGPDGEDDVDDFVATIERVGCDQADPELARLLVEGVLPAVAWLEEMGVQLRRPTDAGEREYIPCFDYKNRAWHGLERASLRETWGRELTRLGVETLPHMELLDLLEEDGRVTGAVLASSRDARVLQVRCGAVVLATGGLAGLYARRLTAADVCGAAQGVALAHGSSLVNAEFLQIMPGLVSPVAGVVVNEKALRFSTLDFPEEILAERSAYGPFTTRLASHVVDEAIAAAGPEGLPLAFHLPDNAPELVASYFDWLHESFGLRPEYEVRVGLYAHASNGGIRIGADASCVGGPTGLFACGECTGGMHGADRIGGLASASALVFGRIAGTSAVHAAKNAPVHSNVDPFELTASPSADASQAAMCEAMTNNALVARTDTGLSQALAIIDEAQTSITATTSPTADVAAAIQTAHVTHQLTAARAMLTAMRSRPTSLGSHHRAD